MRTLEVLKHLSMLLYEWIMQRKAQNFTDFSQHSVKCFKERKILKEPEWKKKKKDFGNVG